MFNTKKSLDTTANLSINMTQTGLATPFNLHYPDQTYDAENTLTTSFYQPNRIRARPIIHNRIASQMREKINSIIFDVQENAFLKTKAVQSVQQTNQLVIQDLVDRKAPVFGGQRSANSNIRQTIEQTNSNFGSVYKHSHTASDIPLSVLMDQTSFQQNNAFSQKNIRVSYFNRGSQDSAKNAGKFRFAINEEVKRNQLLNQQFYFLQKQNEELKAKNIQSIKLQRENQELRRTIKSLSVSDVSRITTSKLLNQIGELKQDGQYLREQTTNFVRKSNIRI